MDHLSKTILIDESLKPVDPKETREQNPARTLLHKYMKIAESDRRTAEDRKHIKTKIPALGSRENVSSNGNYGFFSAVMECYNNHWILDMRPDDWFYTFVQKIAVAIDQQSKSEEVRKFFVDHEGKKTLTVEVPEISPLDVDYSWFLDEMTQKIQENIKTPNYVELMTANFSTSTKTDRIVSSINTMNSMQEFFTYRCIPMCGIPCVIMRGSENDWKCLLQKIENLEKLLQPIQEKLISRSFSANWWENIKSICRKLLESYQGKPDLTWWSSIIFKTEVAKRWGSGGTRRFQATNGWFLTDILGLRDIEELSEIQNPLVSVPMKINGYGVPEEEAAFIAGIVGYVVDKDDDKIWPRVSAVHSWSLLLEPTSAFTKGFQNWEDKIIGA